MNEKNIQEKYLEFQLLNKKLNELHQQLNLVERQLMDLKLTEENLSNLNKVELGTEIFSSIAPGIFVKSELKDNKEILMNIGASIIVKKTIPDAKKTISEKAEEITGIIKQLSKQIEATNSEMHKIQEELIEFQK